VGGILLAFEPRYRPLFSGLGILAGHLAALLGLSFYARRRVGARVWRRLHRLTPPRSSWRFVQHEGRAAAQPETWTVQRRWFAIAALVGFVVPLIGSSVLDLQHDVFLGFYFAAVLALTWAYTTATGADWRAILVRNWKASVLLGVVFAFVLVRNVLSEDATAHPDGVYYWFELIWRGALYGSIDALLLTVLPCTMVHRALGGGYRRGASASHTSARRLH
jgi:hypothetical protein